MNSKDYLYRIKSFDGNYDGDTFKLELDLGYGIFIAASCRLLGADTPEMRGGTDESKAAARLAKKFVHEFISAGITGEGAFFLSHELDKYGRPLGDVIVDNVSLKSLLISESLAVPYFGQNKADVAKLHEENLRVLKNSGKI